MAGLIAQCPFCGDDVDITAQSTWQGVHGWQHMAGTRASGKQGGSDIRLREPLQEWAHAGCISMAKAGVAGRQGTLV